MDFSLGLRLGPRNKKATNQQQPPAPSGHGPPAASFCLSCTPSACACPCPGCPPPTCNCAAYLSYTATCPSCPSLPGPPCTCTCSCPPCPACPPSNCPHSSCVPCSVTCCHPSSCPIYPCPKGRSACPSSCLGYSDNCGCTRGPAWGPPVSTGNHSCCFRGQRTSQRHCLIV